MNPISQQFPGAPAALGHWAQVRPETIAVQTDTRNVTYRDLQQLVAMAGSQLALCGAERCLFLMENGLPWIVMDLAARVIGCTTIPVPTFFSDEQINHVLTSTGADLLVSDGTRSLAGISTPLKQVAAPALRADRDLATLQLMTPPVRTYRPALPPGTRKLTFTSGTTGQPKGICLDDESIDKVAQSLLRATEASQDDRHLSLLPFATLLENIAGIDVTIMAGASVSALPGRKLGFAGSSGLDPRRLVAALDSCRPTSIVTVPQILGALVAVATQTGWRPHYLRHVAVGGAALPAGGIDAARKVGLPAFEGYGLSECSSVVTLNTRANDRPGSVGRKLPHCRIRLAPDGEILVEGATARGIVDSDGSIIRFGEGPIETGDIGRFDAQGFLYLEGRKKEIFITAYGRNVSPGWIECELTATASIAQAAVMGEARPFNIAILVPRLAGDDRDLGAWHRRAEEDIARVNARLPDYARIRCWFAADEPFSSENGLLTWNARLRREHIIARHQAQIDQLYQQETADVL